MNNQLFSSGTKMLFVSASSEETERLGELVGKSLLKGDVIVLTGELGAGKTTFVRGVARSFGVSRGIKSPSFTIMHVYQGVLPLFHIDAYRLGRAELIDLGIEDILRGDGSFLIEWGEKITDILPDERLEIEFYFSGKNERKIFINPIGRSWTERLKETMERLKA